MTSRSLTLVLSAAMLASAPVVGAKCCAQERTESPQTTELIRVELELPRPMFIGTPKDLRSVNLAPGKDDKPRPRFLMLPPGCKNISLKKPVTASDTEPVMGEPEQITDGDKEGRDGSYVEFGAGKQYVQIDLKAPHEIHNILVWHYHAQARVYRDVVVQTADDPDFITNVTTLFNNDNDGSAGLGVGNDYEYIETFEGKLIDAKGVRARYLRLYSNGNTSDQMNHYTEVEVYGKE